MSRHRIGLVGDTHIPEAAADLPRSAYDALEGCELILHCGDLHTIEVLDRLERIAPAMASRGNGDTLTPRVRRPGVPEDPRVTDNFVTDIGAFRVGLTHDLDHTEHRTDADAARLVERRFGERIDIAVYGHTHVPTVRGLADGCALVNPGSPTMPYGYLGIEGVVGFLDIDDDRFEATILDLRTGAVELKLSGPGTHPLERGARPAGGH